MRCTNYNPPKTNGFAIYLRAPGTIILNDMFFCAEIFGDIFPKTGLLILWKIQWTKKLVDFTYELNSRLLQSSIGESYGILLGWPIIRRNKGKHLAVELNSWISLLISKVVCFGLYGTRWPSCNQRGNQHVGCQRMLEAMLRWHSFIPALAISSLLLMLLEHQRIRRIYQLLEGANSSQDGVSISYARNVFDWRTF